MSGAADLEHRRFVARCEDGGPDPATRAWAAARARGFLEPVPDDDELARMAAAWQAETRVLHAIHDLGPRPRGALPADVPVATAAVVEGSLDAGGPAPVPCALVADVTVSATHRGRGLMRQLMAASTAEAVEADVPLVALHAAHPALYARFGFAPAVRSTSVEVDCARFALRDEPGGSVHEADPGEVVELARTVAASSGVLGFGALSTVGPSSNPAPSSDDGRTRCLVHADERGDVDGVLTYSFRGWTPQAQVIDVRSERWSTPAAHGALWRAITATGIASTVVATDVRPDDPLPWMLADRAAWRVTGVADGFSLRVLDPLRALQMRGYVGPDAQLVLDVVDRTGGAAGRWSVRVEAGRATVEASSGAADVTLDVADLAAVYLGAVKPSTLRRAGRVTASDDAVTVLDALLRWPVEPASTLHF
ncbi:GNAT family N-acetyltransferase [Angustibacter peucedani]